MERIKKALERARAERLGQAGSKSQSPGNPPVSLEPNQIEYEQTQVVPVSAKTLSERRIIAGLDQHPASDAFKLLRTQVLQRMQEHGWNMLAVTSPGPGEGKSLTAVNLAVSLVRQFTGTDRCVEGS